MESEKTRSMAETTKRIYIGAPACFALELAIRPVCEAFNVYRDGFGACYIVGSSLERADWRDVDVRLMLTDEAFAREFPRAHPGLWEQDSRWLVLTAGISAYLSAATGLPIDFQIQPQTRANERHKGRRNAIGIRYAEAHS